MRPTVEISTELYLELVKQRRKLVELHRFGVDTWDFYEDAIDHVFFYRDEEIAKLEQCDYKVVE